MKRQTFFTQLFILILMFTLLPMKTNAQKIKGFFESQSDIGKVKTPGKLIYDPLKQTYLLSGSGTNMWFTSDEFHFLWSEINGDFLIRARVELQGTGTNEHRKAGLIVRETLDTNSIYADAALHGDGLTSLQYRRSTGAETEEIRAGMTFPATMQLERRGDTLIMSAAKTGDPLTETGRIVLKINKKAYVGLFVCAHNPDETENALFSNVRLVIPAPVGFVPYQDYGNSRLEIMDVETGDRKIIYTSAEPLEAPNWSRNGEYLIYNSKGLLYKINSTGGVPEVIPTGFADQNNNDHGISFDGKMLAISHHDKNKPEGNNSTIYTLPIEGGTPKEITPKSPSYWHGWSPDGKWLSYTGGRKGQFDIYKIPSNGGDEIQLTNQSTLDDGPEFSPDGKYIYFNSARSGRMQIWRMAIDGSDQEQLTSDEYNNWFPHISPDGKEILFLSYPSSVAAGDHPHYKHVMLRMMPVTGGEPVVKAYVYGGQGTINVPSWSPDGKKVAFVSYTFGKP